MDNVREHVFAELAPLFPGFHFEKSQDAFVRTIPGGIQKLEVPFLNLAGIYTFSLICCVRLNEIEDICNKFNPAPLNYHSMTLTTATPLKYFCRDEEFTFSTLRQLTQAVARLATYAGEINQFMDKHQDACALHRAMETERSRFDNTVGSAGSIRAVVLARYCTGANFEEVVRREEESISTWPKEDQRKFGAVVELLRTTSNS